MFSSLMLTFTVNLWLELYTIGKCSSSSHALSFPLTLCHSSLEGQILNLALEEFPLYKLLGVSVLIVVLLCTQKLMMQ